MKKFGLRKYANRIGAAALLACMVVCMAFVRTGDSGMQTVRAREQEEVRERQTGEERSASEEERQTGEERSASEGERQTGEERTASEGERQTGDGIASAEEEEQAERLKRTMDAILAWQCGEYGAASVQELLDTGYSADAMNGTVQSYVLGLYGYRQDYDYSGYALSLQKAVTEAETVSPVTMQKAAMLFDALGVENPMLSECLNETVGEKGIMSYIYGLLMLDGGAHESDAWTREQLIGALLSLQLQDGGFALLGETGDVDITAMAVQALAPYYGKEGEEALTACVDRALAFLSGAQRTDGDFEAGGKANAESTAQVILALCALERDVWRDEAFIKNGHTLLDGLYRYENGDGGFCHTLGGMSNDMASSQAFCALSAVNRRLRGACFLYDFSSYGEGQPTAGGAGAEQTAPDGSGAGDAMQAAPDGSGAGAMQAAPDGGGAGDAMQTAPDGSRGSGAGTGVRVRCSLAILVLGCGYLVFLLISRKFCVKRLCGTLLVLSGLLAAVWLIRIQTSEEYRAQGPQAGNGELISVSMEIRCDSVAGRDEAIPSDGVIFPKSELEIAEGASVFDLLRQAARESGLQLEYEGTAAGDRFAYVEGIAYLYEAQYGELSGWMYFVNGESPDMGCGAYVLSDGDTVVWQYTTELGKDLEAE